MRLDEATEAYSKELAIRQSLAAIDPHNLDWQNDLWGSYYEMGRVEAGAGRTEEALTNYREALAVIERLTAAYPDQTNLQMSWVGTLLTLALIGDEARARLQQGLTILRRLDAEGRLPADRKSWIGVFEQAIAHQPG
jgi:tetratricopeptide (TPR) repeat protein